MDKTKTFYHLDTKITKGKHFAQLVGWINEIKINIILNIRMKYLLFSGRAEH